MLRQQPDLMAKARQRLVELDGKEVYVKDRYTSGYFRLDSSTSDGKYYLRAVDHSGKFEFRDVAWVEGNQINLRPT